MELDQPNEGHGAFDPERHCGGKTRRGTLCEKTKGWGTSHVGVGRCTLHGGSTPTHVVAASKEIARQACATLGVPIEGDPAEALLELVWEGRGNVAFYRALVQALPVHPVPPAWHTVEGGPDDGKTIRDPGETGIYGPTFHVSGIGTGEAKPHILVQLYHAAIDQYNRVLALAVKANIEDRRLRIAESQCDMIMAVINGVLADLGVAGRPDVPAAVGRHLRLVAGQIA